ncbi:MAG: winged helix-turn-helix transcriptional regulator [Oscillibacter sp.]|nr:winged helix-turn-helix transcriptional regulator [Oscillibacter sp.]
MAQPYKSTCYCTNLRRSARIISDFYDAALKDAEVTVAQYYLLINLSRLGSANITHWAEHVGLDRSTMVRNIKLLQTRGFVRTVEGHGKVFALSPEGERVLELAIPLWQKAQEQIEAVLGKDDTEAIFRISEKLQGTKRGPEA